MAIGSAIVGSLIAGAGSIAGAAIGAGGAKSAARAAAEGSRLAIAEQRAARDQLTELLQPYLFGGQGALARQMSLLGIGANGAGQQRRAIAQFEQSPMFQSLARQGEDAILQNASATGGLRGGNVQGALAQFRPALLNQQLQQQFQNLSGVSALGQNAAANAGQIGMGAANNISNLITGNATNQANAGLASANAWSQGLGGLANAAGGLFGSSGQQYFTPAQAGLPTAAQSQQAALGSLGGSFGGLPPLPGIISGYGSGTFDSTGRQVTF